MDSDIDSFADENDSGNVSTDDDNFAMDVDINNTRQQVDLENYPYEVLTTEDIVRHMVDCIKEVNTVVEVRNTTKIFLKICENNI